MQWTKLLSKIIIVLLNTDRKRNRINYIVSYAFFCCHITIWKPLKNYDINTIACCCMTILKKKTFKRSTFVGSAWSFGFFIPATTANDLRLPRIFHPRFYPLQLFSYLNSWERASIFPIECSVLNKGTTGTIFIMSLVWRGPWLEIEPGTSRTRCQHSTTRLSRLCMTM